MVAAYRYQPTRFSIPFGISLAIAAGFALVGLRGLRWVGVLGLFAVFVVGSAALPRHLTDVVLPVVIASASTLLLLGFRSVIIKGEVSVTRIGKATLGLIALTDIAQWLLIGAVVSEIAYFPSHAGTLVFLLSLPTSLGFCFGLFWRRPFVWAFRRVDRVLSDEHLTPHQRHSPARVAERRKMNIDVRRRRGTLPLAPRNARDPARARSSPAASTTQADPKTPRSRG